MRRLLALLCLMATPAAAQDRAGDFDYYVMSLSWSANWCALEGDARNSPQCDQSAEFGWILHGLWPQYERGYPANCTTNTRPPSRSDTAAMADIMGTSGLAWHQWRKHGVCSGLSSDEYYALSREAYARVFPARGVPQSDPRSHPARVTDRRGVSAGQPQIGGRSDHDHLQIRLYPRGPHMPDA